MLSFSGDQFAPVAIASLVYGGTQSAFLTAPAYAGRHGRADGVPGIPFGVLCALLFRTVLAGLPFSFARAGLMPDVLSGEKFVLGSAIGNITCQTSQILGFVAGSGVVALLDTHRTLGIDAATFGISALIIAIGVRARPAPARDSPPCGPSRRTASGSSSAAARCWPSCCSAG